MPVEHDGSPTVALKVKVNRCMSLPNNTDVFSGVLCHHGAITQPGFKIDLAHNTHSTRPHLLWQGIPTFGRQLR